MALGPLHDAASRFITRSSGVAALVNEKPESEEFDEDEEEVAFEATSEVDFDRLAKDLDAAKKRGQKLGDPAWRRLERRLERQEHRQSSPAISTTTTSSDGLHGGPPA